MSAVLLRCIAIGVFLLSLAGCLSSQDQAVIEDPHRWKVDTIPVSRDGSLKWCDGGQVLCEITVSGDGTVLKNGKKIGQITSQTAWFRRRGNDLFLLPESELPNKSSEATP